MDFNRISNVILGPVSVCLTPQFHITPQKNVLEGIFEYYIQYFSSLKQ